MDMTKLNPNEGLRLFDIKWTADTAGPSPNNNQRIEVFLLGCKKAISGNACKGCFNSITWDINKAEWSWDPIDLADTINEGCDPNNKYITIGGGEPTDQIELLIPFTKRLKEHGFHIMMYTWRQLHELINGNDENIEANVMFIEDYRLALKQNTLALLENLDIIVDGQFVMQERLYQQELGDGMLSSIGSGNQKVFDVKHYNETGELLNYPMRDLAGLYIKPDTNDLIYITKE